MVRDDALSKRPSPSLSAFIREMGCYVRRPWAAWGSFFATLFLKAVTPVASAVFLARCLDGVAQAEYAHFLNYGLLYIAAYLLETAASTWSVLVRVGLTESVASELRKRFVRRAMDMPLRRFEKLSRGDLVSRLTADVSEASRVFETAHVVLSTILRAIGAVFFLLFIATHLGIAVIASLALAAVINSRAGRAMGSVGKEYQAALGALSSYALNAVEGHSVIKSFSAQEYVARGFLERAREVRAKAMSLAARVSKSILGAFSGASVVVLVAFGYGGYLAVAGKITIGAMISSSICTDHISPLGLIGQHLAGLRRAAGAYGRVKEIVEAEVDSDLTADVPGLPVFSGGDVSTDAPLDALISVRDLSYEYEPGVKALDGVSFEVKRGQKVAIVGRSGCGKSTIMKVLAGLYRPEPGRVYIGGLDMAYYRLGKLGEMVTYVPQEPFLFAGSVADNLALGLGEPLLGDGRLDARVTEGLEMACAGFVLDGPQGLSSQVGERGGLLSGGQRQRLCLARGFLRGTQVLLLDEPTSSLDRETEARILSAISSREELTCLIVTHRFDVAEMADVVLVMDSGRLVEAGTHEDLLKRRGLYWSLFTGEISLSRTPSPEDSSEEGGDAQ